ncbi:hypothetical protein S2091_4175 [Solimicrobium silvestre]|uniref:Uncharacterized protein n=1 Tax=Solimicrobium silvestre TaxID=2099400 RepID=A0A2S9GTN0_9BURK|nr:hypothetical protein S2091_4175 [Solimicrobium silvestre]
MKFLIYATKLTEFQHYSYTIQTQASTENGCRSQNKALQSAR